MAPLTRPVGGHRPDAAPATIQTLRLSFHRHHPAPLFHPYHTHKSPPARVEPSAVKSGRRSREFLCPASDRQKAEGRVESGTAQYRCAHRVSATRTLFRGTSLLLHSSRGRHDPALPE